MGSTHVHFRVRMHTLIQYMGRSKGCEELDLIASDCFPCILLIASRPRLASIQQFNRINTETMGLSCGKRLRLVEHSMVMHHR
jgi:hypothetical protein